MNPEKAFELFYTIPMPMSLRGGDAPDIISSEEDDGDEDDEEEDPEDSVMQDALSSVTSFDDPTPPLRGGGGGGDNDNHKDNDTESPPSETTTTAKAPTRQGSLPLWGLSGRTTANFAYGLGSFFWAVDRLLGLRTTSHRENAGITVTILVHPKHKRTPCQVVWEAQCLLGDRRRETDFLAKLGVTLHRVMDRLERERRSMRGELVDEVEEKEWKICVSRISEDRYFNKDAMGKELSYKPDLAMHHLASFSLSSSSSSSSSSFSSSDPLAYLFLPHNINANTAANHYKVWFHSLWRTLSIPQQDAERTYVLGSSTVPAPASCFVRIVSPDGDNKTGYFLSDIGPPRQVWEWLMEAYHERCQREFVMETLPISPSSSSDHKEGALVHIPGYFLSLCNADKQPRYSKVSDLVDAVLDTIPDNNGIDKPTLQALCIRPIKPGSGGELVINVDEEGVEDEGVHVLFSHDIQDECHVESIDHEKLLRDWLADSNITLHVQPRWHEYEARILDLDGETPLIDPHELQDENDTVSFNFHSSERWARILARVQEVYTSILELPRFPKEEEGPAVIIRFDQRVGVDDDATKLDNRTRWDFKAVANQDMDRLWTQFVSQSLSTRTVSVQVCFDEASNAEPFALRDRDPDRFFWGCHDRVDDEIMPYEVEDVSQQYEYDDVYDDDDEVDLVTERPAHQHHHHGAAAPPPPPPQQQRRSEGQAQSQRRTTGWEDPSLQTQGQTSLGYTPQGIPNRGQAPLDDFQRGKIFREWSYGHPLSIHMEGQYPEIPVNAPPLEPLLKTSGPDSNSLSDSVPMLSTQLMTATEQRRLQEAFFKMRSLALERVQGCPFPACVKYFACDDDGTKCFEKHIKDVHVGKQCPLCQDVLLDSWAPWQIAQHFLTDHVDEFSHKSDLRRDLTVAIQSKEFIHSREEQFRFCPRCGRNHEILNAKADRAQHDNLCYPGNKAEDATTKYCASCGEGYTPAEGLYPHKIHEQACKATAQQKGERVHCHDCGLPTHEFSRRYAHKHILHCKGADCKRVNWCPWCGIDLKLTAETERHTHLDTCGNKPHMGRNPIDTNTGEPMDSPRDTAEIRRRETHFRPMMNQQRFLRVEVPRICPIRACNEDLSLFNAGGLFKHFYSSHREGTNAMKACPICHLDFQARGWAHLDQKVQHLDDHMQRREDKLLGDFDMSRAKGVGDDAVIEGAVQRRNRKPPGSDPQERAVAAEEELARTRRVIAEMQRERADVMRNMANPGMARLQPDTSE